MERRMVALLPPVTALEDMLATALPERYRRWQAGRDEVLAQARAAPARHVAALQDTLAGCEAPDAGTQT
jgi:hypothetical protein